MEERIDRIEAEDPSQAIVADADGNYQVGDCPIVGNLNSGLYHVPGQAKYAEMLKINKCAIEQKCEDNRICFETEAEARAGKKIFVTKNRQVTINWLPKTDHEIREILEIRQLKELELKTFMKTTKTFLVLSIAASFAAPVAHAKSSSTIPERNTTCSSPIPFAQVQRESKN